MLTKRILPLVILIILSACAIPSKQLTPLDQAKMNIHLFNTQMKVINDTIESRFRTTTSLEEMKIQQELDKKLLEANNILIEYIKSVKLWEQTGMMQPSTMSYEQQFKQLMPVIFTLLNKLSSNGG